MGSIPHREAFHVPWTTARFVNAGSDLVSRREGRAEAHVNRFLERLDRANARTTATLSSSRRNQRAVGSPAGNEIAADHEGLHGHSSAEGLS